MTKPLCDGGKERPRIITKTGYIEVKCACGDSIEMPDKGLGRAAIAAWKSRHQPPKPI